MIREQYERRRPRNPLRPWVVNASPLILLGKIGQLDLLASFTASVAVPGSVIREIAVESDDDPETETTLSWARARTVADMPLPAAVAHWDLRAGKSQVLARCLADGGVAVLDHGEARAGIQSLGLPLSEPCLANSFADWLCASNVNPKNARPAAPVD